ncbi:aspartate kinase [Roseivirga sp. BDSF3-8]|uniref:aspartate kinase n=1 Tax=Roseivirga sp. BDSF3-8 TaxID=3241598 RepID=UPI00353234A1
MKIFKFGGASVKDASAVQNVAQILDRYRNDRVVVVISAMGKTTNALEKVLALFYEKNDWSLALREIREFHDRIVDDLFGEKNPQQLRERLAGIFEEVVRYLSKAGNFVPDEIYDKVISVGELVSTTIVESYLDEKEYSTCWLDARRLVRTDSRFRNARVDWEITRRHVRMEVERRPDTRLFITQGFIGSDHRGRTVTLGREGSDYTAAIMANCLDAESVTIWKDVPGILNGDPKLVRNTLLYKELPYREAAEMTYYGASVIHPKTIRPLGEKNIPLYVRSFINYEEPGTVIHDCQVENLAPAVIFKFRQVLLTFSMPNFTFINEKHLTLIFHALDTFDIRLNVMQNSAVSISICADYRPGKLKELLQHLGNDFQVKYNLDVNLVTIKNFTEEVLAGVIADLNPEDELLLEQRSRNNVHLIVQPAVSV